MVVGIVIVVVIAVAAVGIITWRKQNTGQTGCCALDPPQWSFDGQTWKSDQTPPQCKEPLAIASPVDTSQLTNILYPGQVRGGDFKPHGGLGIEGAMTNTLEVRTVLDSYLYRGSRYIEQGETQYLFDFINDCGIMFRFDHLKALSPEFQKYADKLPPAQPNMSQTTLFEPPFYVASDTVVGTEVGFAANKNVFFDFGVYDLRQPNTASKTSLYQTDQQRIQDKEQSFFAVCFIDLLQGNDKAAVQALTPRNPAENSSDYCQVN